MKTTVGLLLLLLAVYYCAAASQGPIVTTPGECCFTFFTGKIPAQKIVSVTKTHRNCLEKAFVVHTAAGKKVCVSQSVAWAREAFDQQQISDE